MNAPRLLRVIGFEIDEVVHVANAPDLEGGAAQTLCGWVDVTAEDVNAFEAVPDCESCRTIVAYCKSLKGVPKP